MRLPTLRVIALLLMAVPVMPSAQQRLTADDIARRVQDRDTGRDSRATMRMKLYDRQGRVRERSMTLLSLRGRGTPGAGPAAPDGDRLLIRFSYPNDIRGTGFLVWEHPKQDDERFLYLPSLGRVRRIAGTETQESFVGSDFTYEDIGGRELDDYTYAIVDENASWTRHQVGAHDPRGDSNRDERTRPRVPARRLARAEGQLRRRRGRDLQPAEREAEAYTVRRLEQVEGIWTAMDAR